MPDQIRVGVVGTSWWPSLVHLPSLRSHPNVQVAAICGRARERAQSLAASFDIPLVFTNYREMIETADLGALVICAPDDLHFPMAMDALEAGLHVLCEKPLALTAEEATQLWKMAEAQRLKHMTFFTYRWLPGYRHLQRLLAQGEIGRVNHCEISCLAGYGRQAGGWRFDPNRSRGVLGDLGSHCIDLARWLVGDIVQVSAALGSFGDHPSVAEGQQQPTNDSASLTVQFASGAQGMIYASTVAHVGAHVQQQRIVLHGESGSLESTWSLTGGGTIVAGRADRPTFELCPIPDDLWEGGGTRQPSFMELGEAFRRQSIGDRLFIDAILEDKPISPSFYDGAQAQAVVDAALASAREGRRITL